MKEILPWDARYKVAIGIAEALKYLHDECMRPVIHRDVKSSNILLDSSLKPQVFQIFFVCYVSLLKNHVAKIDIDSSYVTCLIS